MTTQTATATATAPTPEEQLVQLRQAHDQQMAAMHESTLKVIEVGREEFGAEAFDEMSASVADAIGRDNIGSVMSSIIETDMPDKIIAHLAQHPDEAKKIAQMNPSRRSAALGRIESQLLPHSNGPSIGADPAWKHKAAGRVNLNDDTVSDQQWSRAFDRKMRDRQR